MAKNRTKLITSAMAAKILGFSLSHVRRLILEGKIKAEKLGHDYLMSEKDIAHITRRRKANIKDESNERSDDQGC
jgi:excisionase family DNA binding protein